MGKRASIVDWDLDATELRVLIHSLEAYWRRNAADNSEASKTAHRLMEQFALLERHRAD